jgi:hypothetical protein
MKADFQEEHAVGFVAFVCFTKPNRQCGVKWLSHFCLVQSNGICGQ